MTDQAVRSSSRPFLSSRWIVTVRMTVVFLVDAEVYMIIMLAKVLEGYDPCEFVKCITYTVHCLTGVDFQNKVLDVDGHTVALQLWDTAGQER